VLRLTDDSDDVCNFLLGQGFRPLEGGGYWKPFRGKSIGCALGVGPNRLHSVTWWIPLETATDRDDSVYRSSGRPVLDAPFSLDMRRETSVDRSGKRLGLNREVQTGDRDFDAYIYLETDDTESAREVLASGELRRIVLELVRGEIEVVALRKGLGRLSAVRSEDLQYLDGEWLDRLCDRLARAHDELPRFRCVLITGYRGPNAYQRTGCALFLLAIPGFGAAGWAPKEVVIATATSPTSVAISAVGVAVLAGVVWQLCKRSTAGLRHFTLIFIPAALAWCLWTVGIALMLR